MLVSLAKLKNYLKITDTTNDTLLSSLVDQASVFIESYTGRKLEAQDYNVRMDGHGENEFLFPQYPINTLTSFQYNTGNIGIPVWENYSTDGYFLDSETGIFSLTFGIHKGIKNIKVVCNAGYDTIPEDLQRACMQIATYYYSQAGKTTSQVKRERVDGAEIEYDTSIGGIEQDSYVILNKYKKYV